MPINCYTGLQGSGKSFEVVASVIVPAIKSGRNVVTNIEGINEKEIHDYIVRKTGQKLDKQATQKLIETLGSVIHCTNEEVLTPGFFPSSVYKLSRRRPFSKKEIPSFFNRARSILPDKFSHHRARRPGIGRENIKREWWHKIWSRGTKTLVKPGDLVCIDEAWRFWSTDKKLPNEHMIFMREHRHYTHPKTKVSCDLVMMTQDIGDLNRTLKTVVELSFRTEKKKSLGLHKVYSVQMWEGYKMNRNNCSSSQVKKYDPAIFPLYQSYTGGVGREKVIDKRQNILKRPIVYFSAIAILIVVPLSCWSLYRFFTQADRMPKTAADIAAKAKGGTSAVTPATASTQTTGGPVNTGPPGPPPPPPYSAKWRLVGTLRAEGITSVILKSSVDGFMRIESANGFVMVNGSAVSGMIDGERVTQWTGTGAATSTQTPSTPPAAHQEQPK
jgi:zona occludens toxin